MSRLLLESVLQNTDLDVLQFAYQKNKSADDAILTLVHTIQQHIDSLGAFVRALFVDLSSAFNLMQPSKLIEKLQNWHVNPTPILWISNFLQNRVQRVSVSGTLSDPIITNTGSPQGCVLSPFLFILYTNDCQSDSIHTKILKYADYEMYPGRVLDKVESLLGVAHHPLGQNYHWLRSGRRLQSLRCRTNRFLNSFVPSSIRLWNSAS